MMKFLTQLSKKNVDVNSVPIRSVFRVSTVYSWSRSQCRPTGAVPALAKNDDSGWLRLRNTKHTGIPSHLDAQNPNQKNLSMHYRYKISVVSILHSEPWPPPRVQWKMPHPCHPQIQTKVTFFPSVLFLLQVAFVGQFCGFSHW